MECRKANGEGRGRVTMEELIRASLRMRPDRIIVGEVRGGEVVDMINAMKENPSLDVATYINRVCRNILKNVAVFKEDEKSQKAYDAFLKEALN